MLIPGLPPAGTQQEVFKPDRKVKTSAAEGLAHDPLAELPMEEQHEFQHSRQHTGNEQPYSEDVKTTAEQEENLAPGSPELSRKGLMVDIRA